MRNKLHRSIIGKSSWLLLVLLVACKKETPQPPVVNPTPTDELTVNVFPFYSGDTLHLDSTYQTPEGYDFQFTDLKFYVSHLKNGTDTLVRAALFDYREKGNLFFQVPKTPTNFSSLDGFLGVESALNHADPTAFANEDPLHIVNAGGMHWGWNPGYIFVKVEIRVDTISDGIPLFDHLAVYHVGTDAFIQSLSFPEVTWVKQQELKYKAAMKLDMNRFFVNGNSIIDVKNEFIMHSAAGQEALSLKAISNFKSALSFIN